jgi:hypothetical protein
MSPFKTASILGDKRFSDSAVADDFWENWRARLDCKPPRVRKTLSCRNVRCVLSAGGGPVDVSMPWLLREAGGRLWWRERASKPVRLVEGCNSGGEGELLFGPSLLAGPAMGDVVISAGDEAWDWPLFWIDVFWSRWLVRSRGHKAVSSQLLGPATTLAVGVESTDPGADADADADGELSDEPVEELRRALNLRNGISASAGFESPRILRGEQGETIVTDGTEDVDTAVDPGAQSIDRRPKSVGCRVSEERWMRLGSVCLLGRAHSATCFVGVTSVVSIDEATKEGAISRRAPGVLLEP